MRNRRLLVVLMSVLIVLSAAFMASAADGKFTIVHVNDVHGRLEPWIPTNETVAIGGMGRLFSYVDGLRDEGKDVLLLASGDMVHGTNIVNLFNGVPMAEVMRDMGFAATSLGNHEFNYGQKQLLNLESIAGFPFLAANIVYEDGSYFTMPYAVKTINGIKVGMFGLSPVDTPIVTHPNNVIGLKFLDPIDSAMTVMAELEESADIIICLSHLGYEEDLKLAKAMPGIDIIVGGHSHTVLDKPVKVGPTVIVSAGEWAAYAGTLEVTVKNNAVTAFEGKLVRLDEKVADARLSSRVGARIKVYGNALAKEMNVVIGKALVDLDGERANVRTKETNMGNLVTDIMKGATKADIALTNGGGIRASIKAGDITVGGVISVLPFDNSLVVIQLRGDAIVKALELSVGSYPNQLGGFLQVSGLTFKFDPAKPAGSRVVEVKVNGLTIDPYRLYSVATNDFTAAGGDGYAMFKDAKVLYMSGEMLRDVAIKYIKGLEIAPKVEGRISVVK